MTHRCGNAIFSAAYDRASNAIFSVAYNRASNAIFSAAYDRASNAIFSEAYDRASNAIFFFFFFWWGLLHGPQQGPDRMKEKPIRLGKGNSCLNRKTLLEKPV